MAIFGRSAAAGSRGISPFKAGLIAIVLVVVGSYFAYTQANPFADPFQFEAAFNTTNNLKPDSPVRIAGVEVGTVTEVKPTDDGEAGMVTMEILEHGLPIHEDAELKIRPRIFLEGNEFVDLEPGTPSAPVLESGDTVPINQTAAPVQFGQVLAILQSDTREDLKTFLNEYATVALKNGGARGFRRSIRYWEEAYKNSALANEAVLGTQEGDLFRLLKGQQRTFDALASEPDQLRGLVTNFNTTAAAFAAEDDALQATIPALRDVLRVGRPALASLNATFPGVQAFAVDALPAAESSQVTVPASFPLVQQLNRLFRPSELRGLARDLRQSVPPLTRVNKRTIPLLQQNRALSACTNNVLVPFARTPIPTGDPGSEPADSPDADPDQIVEELDFPYDPDSSGQPFMRQSGRAFTGLSGESRTTDANGKFFRANFKLDTAVTFVRPGTPALGDALLTLGAIAEGENARPAPPPLERGDDPQFGHRRPSFRPDFPCELSVTPDLRAPSAAAAGTFDPGGQLLGPIEDILDELGLPPLGGSEASGAEVTKAELGRVDGVEDAEKLVNDLQQDLLGAEDGGESGERGGSSDSDSGARGERPPSDSEAGE